MHFIALLFLRTIPCDVCRTAEEWNVMDFNEECDDVWIAHFKTFKVTIRTVDETNWNYIYFEMCLKI